MRPPKKSWKNIANLSGGEKTLSSLSLVFALHHFKPTPLYVMDEIDAALGEGGRVCVCVGQSGAAGLVWRRPSHMRRMGALSSFRPGPAWLFNPHVHLSPVTCHLCVSLCADFKNVSIVGHYIKERTRNAQFVIISLRNNMFELADRLVGIYKVGG